jgi:2-methylcitrate dehydratase PrpD
MSVNTQANPSRLYGLASWATSLRYEDIPPAVIDRTKDFFLDTFACTLGGRDHAAIIALVGLTKKMGPASGPCEVIPFPEMKTSPAFAALVNGACSHVVEQDDLHNYSIMHPVNEISFHFF